MGTAERPKKKEAERAIQREALTHLSEQAFGAPQSVRDRATHYLNPDVPGMELAKQTWAQDWQNWDQVGKRPVAHFFGVGKGEAPPPDYDGAGTGRAGNARQRLPAEYAPACLSRP